MVAELAFCIAGIYGCFLTWGVLQERVSTTAYPSTDDPLKTAKFTHFVFLNLVQSIAACIIAYVYLRWMRGLTLGQPSLRLLRNYAWVAFLGYVRSYID
jgi:UDP-galactose transporter B1